MNDDRLTEKVAALALGWKATPDRFIKAGRSWIPRWRFRPFVEFADAFRLLDHAADHYILTGSCSTFATEVQIDSCWGKSVGEHKARTITLAVARALQLEVDNGELSSKLRTRLIGAPSTDGDESPRFGADYGQTVPSVN